MEQIRKAVQQIIRDLYETEVSVALTRPDEQFGDFATNVALQLAKQLGKNPREVADEIVEQLPLRVSDMLESVSVAGPGFINIRLSDQALIDFAREKTPPLLSKKTIVIETNNPNPFKAMHIGHAFNAIIADSIANLLDTGGASVYRVSYHGDVGLHVGKSMYSLLRYAEGSPERLQEISEADRNSFMSRMYAEGSAAYKQDEAAKKEIDDLARQSFKREDPVYAAVYDIVKDWSFAQIDRNVARLGNKPVERRFLESDAEYRGVEIVKKNVPNVFQESDGALVFKGSDYGAFDNVFVSARGTGLYASRDLGLIQLKNEQYHPDKSV